MLSAGLVGLPNVGKSTIFNAITNSKILSANYPFATIEPNIAIVDVKDKRLDELTKIYNTKSTIYASCEFKDIAGLVRGASKGEGLGNQFLNDIKESDAILQVIRCFKDDNIIHVDGIVDPIKDIETICLELILSDIDVVEKRILKVKRRAEVKDKDAVIEYNLLLKLKEELENERDIKLLELDDEETKIIKSYGLLTYKPFLFIANVSEDSILDLNNDENYKILLKYAMDKGIRVVPICAKLEEELLELDDETKKEYLKELGLEKTGLDDLIKTTYELLGYRTYFTAGVKECRAWTFKDGMKAPECAGIIHTDFQRGFIKAEIVSYDDLYKCGSFIKAKESGLVRLEGKEYKVKDGDVITFKFNV